MPLTSFQQEIAELLAENRSKDSHLAGGAALHFAPNSLRYSMHLDYFHGSEDRVASAFTADSASIKKAGFKIEIEMSQIGYIRCIISKDRQRTKIE